MKIEELFEAYQSQVDEIPDVDDIFFKSGTVNKFRKLDFGFFPLGSGILTDRSKVDEAEIGEGGIMVLGNDFGTTNYLKNKCGNGREDNSRTIKNLETIGIEKERTFFTNFFLGLRDDINYPETTMTKLIAERKQEYKDFCFKFFLIQLKMVKPRIVICIGKDVGFVLYEYFENEFLVFEKKNVTYRQLYEIENENAYEVMINNLTLGERKFVFIPHPSWAQLNWKNHDIKSKIKSAIQQ